MYSNCGATYVEKKRSEREKNTVAECSNEDSLICVFNGVNSSKSVHAGHAKFGFFF